LARFGVETQKVNPEDEPLSVVLERFDELSKKARELSLLLRSLSDEEIILLKGGNPYDDWDLDDAAMKQILSQYFDDIAAPPSGKGDETTRSKKQMRLRREYGKLRDRIYKAASSGVLYLANLPALRPEDDNSAPDSPRLEPSLADMLRDLAEGADLRRIILFRAISNRKGRGKLSDRLGTPRRTAFLRACALVFLEMDLPVKNSESGGFFRFCATLIDTMSEDAKFSRDRHFRRVCKEVRRMRELQGKVTELRQLQLRFADQSDLPENIAADAWIIRATFGEKINALTEELAPLQTAFDWNPELRNIIRK